MSNHNQTGQAKGYPDAWTIPQPEREGPELARNPGESLLSWPQASCLPAVVCYHKPTRQPGETYLDFWRNQEIAVDRWLNSWEAFVYSELRAVVLLEQFKAGVSREVEMFLNERAVKSPREAAELADNYEVIHGKKSTSEVGRRRPVDSFSETTKG